MDAHAAKAGLFSFLSRQPPTGNGGWENGAKFLRLAGLAVLVAGGLNVLVTILYYVMLVGDPVFGPLYAGGVLPGLVFGVAFLVAGIWWVNWTYNHWCNRDIRGYKHALVIAILLVVFGGLGAFGALGSFGLASIFAGTTLGTLVMVQALVGLVVGAAYLATGILVLVNRNKPDAKAAFGQASPTGYTPHA